VSVHLTVSRPGDADERAAEQLAARALSGRGAPTGFAPRRATVARSGGTQERTNDPTGLPARLRRLDEGGASLPAAPRAFFERGFGHDFGHVRVHAGEYANRLARDLDARAFVVGRHIGFRAGAYAPASPAGRSLLAHELAHVVQTDGGAATTRVRRDLVYGSGYKNRFASEAAEADGAAAKKWFPASADFAATAQLSGGGTGAKTFDELITTIGGKGAGTIKQLGIIGHANADAIALAGTIAAASVTGAANAMIDATTLTAKAVEVAKVKDRFAADGRITLFGCNSGASGALLAAISNAFGVCAEGFKDEITWCLKWTVPGKRIVSRGKTAINPPTMNCDTDFNDSVLTLTPDTKSCVGAPAQAAPRAPWRAAPWRLGTQ
jgi:Domain of unknown function (DUF4157)